MFDNVLFNINGRGPELLADVIKLAITQEGSITHYPNIVGWRFDEEYGVLLANWVSGYATTPKGEGYNIFTTPLTPLQAAEFTILELNKHDQVPLGEWEDDADHDGHNTIGWRAYREAWGHFDNDYYGLLAIKQVYLWHGK